MRTFQPKTLCLSAFVLFLLAATPAVAARPVTLVQVDQQELIDELRALQSQVKALKSRTNHGRKDQEMRSGLDSVNARLERLEKSIRSSRPLPPPDRRPSHVAVSPIPMDPPSFTALRRSVANGRFSSEKLFVLETAARSNFFEVEQVRVLLGDFFVSGDRLDALRVLWPSVLDRANGYRLIDSFTFESEKRTAQQILMG
ncbi:DUF4476 domain-containing protein [Vulgatibacter incomptus]|uniref:DUF4476 domain-containing protein n=1 Tax=Vulgatibacter incomptus TaxID=1391653 RepID=A0A0K1PBI5_9BACT|nr:DUF4476 domain-containing protein [Vulgatibacter incomptus]AKU90857.1 hypothetical protein AKJ08_1244 [Vulgatibacter incomptus]